MDTYFPLILHIVTDIILVAVIIIQAILLIKKKQIQMYMEPQTGNIKPIQPVEEVKNQEGVTCVLSLEENEIEIKPQEQVVDIEAETIIDPNKEPMDITTVSCSNKENVTSVCASEILDEPVPETVETEGNTEKQSLSPVVTNDETNDRGEQPQTSVLEENHDTGSPVLPKVMFAEEEGCWSVLGASVQGNGHILQGNLPCQDNCKYESLGNGWGIAITSDGAGSASLSQVGSKIVVERGIAYIKALIEKEKWIENNTLPDSDIWEEKSFYVLKAVRDDLEKFAIFNNIDFKSLSATSIAVVHSPYGLLVTHVGDGRAGYCGAGGEWLPLIKPHKGEEANQTIFLTSGFWNIPFYKMSGARVPESKVIKDDSIKAFVMMSDGCETTSWTCNVFDSETNKYHDPNKPFERFFNPLVDTVHSFVIDNIPLEDRAQKWYDFICEGNKGFVKEQDDKTMILAVRL